jgi:hypothetical protein
MSEIDRANKAKAIIENPLYDESWNLVRDAIITRIEKCPLSDTATAEDLRRCLKLLRDVRANLTQVLNSGKIAAFNLAEDEKRRQNPLRNLFR